MNPTLLTMFACQLPTASAGAADSVEAGREALDRWWWWSRYPWYDAQSDGVRRVELPKPWDWSWLWDWLPNWSFNLGWLWPTTLIQWIAWIAIILLLGAAVYLMVRAFLGSGEDAGELEGVQSKPDDNDIERVAALPFPVSPGRLDLLGEARRHYREGNYRQAIIYLFSFQLVQLDKNHIIRLTKGKTNRQYLREVGPRRTLRGLVEQTMVAFEDVFFGNHALERSRFESCWSRLDEFESLATEGVG